MTRPSSIELLRRLSLAAGPPGTEDEVRGIVRQVLAGVGPMRHDRLGSLTCELRGSADAPRVMLDSHLDEVAFMTQSVSSEGLLAIVALGGWWGHVVLGQRVEVMTEDGRVPGVIGSKPPHFLTAEDRTRVIPVDAMFIDVGASTAKQVAELGIRVGDPIVPAAPFVEMAVEGVVSGKAFDNRAGVALMCEALLDLAERDHPNTVVGVAAVQEELGGRGARVASELVACDVAVVLECAPADDLPGRSERQGALGHGPQLRYLDPTAISNRRLVRFVRELADAEGIGIQVAVRRSGGTDAAQIQRSHHGVPTVVIAVPARYIHSHAALLDLADYRAARALVVAIVARLDAATVASFVDFD